MPYVKLEKPYKSLGREYWYQHKCETCGKLSERHSNSGELGKQLDYKGNVVMTESDECHECFMKHDNIQI